MNRITTLALAALLAGGTSVATAADSQTTADTTNTEQMKKADTDGDGMISKTEHMKAMEKAYDAMPKKNGMVEQKLWMHQFTAESQPQAVPKQRN